MPTHPINPIEPHEAHDCLHGPQRWAGAELLFLLAVTAIGAALRLVGLTDVPPGFHGDEALIGLEAQRIVREGGIGVWSPSGTGGQAGIFYWAVPWILALPPTVLTVRLCVAALAAATVPLFYLFCREMFGRRAAIIGSLFLATSYWAINYSRIAFQPGPLPPLLCATLYLLARAVNTGRPLHFLAAGMFIAAAGYVYASTAFFVASLAAPLLWMLWQDLAASRVAGFARRLAGLALMTAGATAALWPLLLFMYNHPDVVRTSSAARSIKGEPFFRAAGTPYERIGAGFANAARSMSAIAFTPRRQDRDYVDGGGDRALLAPPAAALLALGIVVAWRRRRNWQYLLIPSGIAIAWALQAGLNIHGGMYRRAVAALPMVFAAIGIGGDALLGWIAGRPPGSPAVARLRRFVLYPSAIAGVGLLLTVTAMADLRFYFVQWPRDGFARWVYCYDFVKAIDYLNSLPGRPYVYFYGERWPYNYEIRRFLAADLPGEDRSRAFGHQKEPGLGRDRDGPVVFLFFPPHTELAEVVTALYPGGRLYERRDSLDGKPTLLFTAYYLPK